MATFPATTYRDAVDLAIDSSNQLHRIMNEDATSTINTESGPVDSLRKALTDNFYFKTPIDWAEGLSETNFNQLRGFTDGLYYYAPTATSLNPISMGPTPVGDPNWVLSAWGIDTTLAQNVQDVIDAKDTAVQAASDALTSETNAATSETNAFNSAVSAGAALTEFKGVFYGALASDPTLDPNGDAPTEGDWYFNTTAKGSRQFDGTNWQDIGTAKFRTFVYTATGGETSLSGLDDSGNNLTYSVNIIQVYKNGALLVSGSDYVATDGISITDLTPLQLDDIILIHAFIPFSAFAERGQVETTIASGAVNLTEASQTYQFVDTGGVDRNVVLPATNTNGLKFVIKNISSSGGLIDIIDSDTVTVLYPDIPSPISITVISDGSIWWVL